MRIARTLVLLAAWLGALGGCGSSAPPARSSSAASTRSAAGSGPWAQLTVVYRPHGQYPVPGQSPVSFRWALTCGPPGGTHPEPGAACQELAHHSSDLSHPGLTCLIIVRGGRSASVSGVVSGRLIRFATSPCSEAWRTLPALLSGSPS